MELQEIITEIILGLFLIFISYQVGCKGNFHSFIVIIIETLIQKIQKLIPKELVWVVCLLG